MTRRSGLTLVEVLTALFIMGLGVIAILTLFPLGAMQMGQAIRDSRSTESAFNADQYMRNYWKTYVVEAAATDDIHQALTNPNYSSAGFAVQPKAPPASTGQASYPVVVDPMGWVARLSLLDRSWVGDGGSTFVPRRTLVGAMRLMSGPEQNHYSLRICSLMDTLGFTEGVPNNDRELRYNWLWVLHQSNFTDRLTANMTVVVFDRRAHLHATAGAEDVLTSTFNAGIPGSGAVPGTSSVTFDSYNAETKIQPGTWIMDATISPTVPVARPGIRHANFYRVTAVTGNTVELQTPIKTPSDNGGAYTATFIVWRGVSGVYVRSPLTAGNN